jgi:hypothetical protein
MMEDLHAAYWVSHSGGYRRPSSIMETVKTMIDDLHHWYHGRGQSVAATTDNLAAIHVHDSITVLEKARPGSTLERGARARLNGAPADLREAMFWGKLPGRSAARDRRAIILGGRFPMCHGHVDLRTIEREVQDRLRAASPVAGTTGDEPITVPPA